MSKEERALQGGDAQPVSAGIVSCCFIQVARTMQRREGTFTKWADIDFHIFIGIREEKEPFNHLLSIIRAELLPAGHLLVVCQLWFRKLSCSVQYNGF